MTNSPTRIADALSEVMKSVRMTGAVFFNVDAKAPWVVELPPRDVILPLILPDAEHLISYHIVVEGSCFAAVDGGDPIELHAGEVIVMAGGDPHVISSIPGMRADPTTDNRPANAESNQFPFPVKFGKEGPVTARLICGFLACDTRPFNPLLENLPQVMVADSSEGKATWLKELISLTMREAGSRSAGRETVLGRFSELLFIEVVRQYLKRLPPGHQGWLAGLRDPFVGKALSLLHYAPSRDWTLEDLARQVGTSRSQIAERFTCLVRIPPMQYLAKWRMQIAAGLLSNNENIAAVAGKIGYGSEAAFSRAFKKHVGIPPSHWRDRKSRRQANSPSPVQRAA